MLGGLGSRGILNLNSRVLAQVVIPVRQSRQTIYGISPATRKGRKENYPNLGELVLGGMNIRIRDVASESRNYLS